MSTLFQISRIFLFFINFLDNCFGIAFVSHKVVCRISNQTQKGKNPELLLSSFSSAAKFPEIHITPG